MLSLALPQVSLLALELLVYLGVMLSLFRYRDVLGIGAFFCALGSLHFLETWLAATVYVSLPYGIAISPGSVILFTGKLMMVLMIYIVEDASAARQPIYGLFTGNLLMFGLAFLVRQHGLVQDVPSPGFALLDQMGWLMLWGTTLLFIDCLLAILLYEKISRLAKLPLALRLWLTAVLVLTFDQVGFFAALHWSIGLPWSAAFGGWLGKMVAAAICALVLSAYLRWCEPAATRTRRTDQRLGDLFEVLTYRQRYEALAAASHRDSLTGLLHRGRFDPVGRHLMEASAAGVPLSLLLMDIDTFKAVNTRFGYSTGDAVLRQVADALAKVFRGHDHVIRYGGEKFAAFLPGTTHAQALIAATRLRGVVADLRLDGLPIGTPPLSLTISVGVATTPNDGDTLARLLDVADTRLDTAKKAGRDQVVGGLGLITHMRA